MSVDSVAAAVTVAENLEFSTAMDITCNLYRAKEELIPSISNSSAVTFIVKKLNLANLDDSCAWLSEVVASNGGTFEKVNVGGICKRWSNIKQFNTTSDRVKNIRREGETSSDSAICRSWVQQVNTASSATLDPDQLCPSSL